MKSRHTYLWSSKDVAVNYSPRNGEENPKTFTRFEIGYPAGRPFGTYSIRALTPIRHVFDHKVSSFPFLDTVSDIRDNVEAISMAGCWKIGGSSTPLKLSRRPSAQPTDNAIPEDATAPSTSAHDQNSSTSRRPTFAALRYRRRRRSKPRRHKQLQRGKKLFSVRLEDDDDEDEDDYYADTGGGGRAHASASSSSTSNACALRKARLKRLFLCGRGIRSDPEDGMYILIHQG